MSTHRSHQRTHPTSSTDLLPRTAGCPRNPLQWSPHENSPSTPPVPPGSSLARSARRREWICPCHAGLARSRGGRARGEKANLRFRTTAGSPARRGRPPRRASEVAEAAPVGRRPRPTPPTSRLLPRRPVGRRSICARPTAVRGPAARSAYVRCTAPPRVRCPRLPRAGPLPERPGTSDANLGLPQQSVSRGEALSPPSPPS
mmetsp:Transcript_119636/g.381778  ORF Transcript_119636/g.381778 Transcript_119636/m.381778 type:complete len:202 (-) Transcript_119636:1774-2379(-)